LMGPSKQKDGHNSTQHLDAMKKAFHEVDAWVDPPMLALPFIEQNVGIFAEPAVC
jgi:hypothetical protein